MLFKLNSTYIEQKKIYKLMVVQKSLQEFLQEYQY